MRRLGSSRSRCDRRDRRCRDHPAILDLLNHAYGFAGGIGPLRDHPLPAPQAGLISALAQGVLLNNVDWSLIERGRRVSASP